MAKEKTAIYSNKRTENKTTAKGGKISIDIRQDKKDYTFINDRIKRELKEAPNSPMPLDLQPMLATITKEPFNNADWIFEIKWDGYRCISYVNKGNVELKSRSNLSFNEIYATLVAALKSWPVNVVIDGEVVVLNEQGKADFEALQNWQRNKIGTLVYYVFDILWLDGKNLMMLPLIRRREILKSLLPDYPILR